ncbi:MAG: hypothetical protein WAM30_08835 [Candidatus Dormiibacterota bacterium]
MDPVPSSEPAPEREGDRQAAVERALRELPSLHAVGRFARSSNGTFLAWLGTAPPAEALLRRLRMNPGWDATEGDGLLTVYKPRRGETPLWDFSPGTLASREVASYRVACSLGWPRIPPTVLRREGPFGAGSLQLFLDADEGLEHLEAGAVDQARWSEIAVFDVLVNNADRKGGHCLLDAAGALWAIDHGLTFHREPKLRTILWEFAGSPLPARLRPSLERVAAGLQGGRLAQELHPLIEPAERRALRGRLAALLHPSWRFPDPGTRWAVPWPPI